MLVISWSILEIGGMVRFSWVWILVIPSRSKRVKCRLRLHLKLLWVARLRYLIGFFVLMLSCSQNLS